MGEKIRIGIPRTLFYYNYAAFWITFFEELELDVVLSHSTNKELLDKGLKASINEICIPIKLLFGHFIDLKTRVDYVFMPYYVTVDKESYICPKLIASPDIIKANFPDVNLLTIDIDINTPFSSILGSLKKMVLGLGVSPLKVVSAAGVAVKKQKRFEELSNKGYGFRKALKHSITDKKIKDEMDELLIGDEALKSKKTNTLSIAVVGHSYVINDLYISSNLIPKLRDNGIKVFTSDMVSSNIIKDKISVMEKVPHWTFGNRVLGSVLHFSEMENVDGIIYVTPFGCSSDSLLKEYLDVHMKTKKAFMTITVDEHSGEAGLVTRFEAFLDMITLRKNKEGKL